MYLAYKAPHWPLHALPEDQEKYKNRYDSGWDQLREERYQQMQNMGILPKDIPLSPRTRDLPDWEELSPEEKAEWSTRMTLYAAVVDHMDQGIGQIIQKLKAENELDNTLIIFLSDNGASPERMRHTVYPTDGEPGSDRSFPWYGAPWANVSNTPYRYYKAWLQEGGIVTPMIAHWPEVIPKGKINQQTRGHIMDLMATSLEAAGVDYPAKIGDREITPTPGKSLLPAFRGETTEGHPILFWEHEGARAVRRGKWKLVSNKFTITKDKWERNYNWQLFDLEKDPAELTDLSSQETNIVEELMQEYDNWARERQVLTPQGFDSVKTAYKNRLKP